jgi:hypothetical protein
MTDTATTEIEIFVMIDQDGDYVIAKDADDLGSRYEEEIHSSPPNATRVFALKLTVPMPKATVVTATLPDTDGPVTVTVS